MLYPAIALWAALCALQDARQKRISNYLTLSGGAIALVHLLVFGESLAGAAPLQAVGAAALMLLIMLPGYLAGKVGAADVKMLFTLGLATDLQHILWCIAFAGMSLLLWAIGIKKLWPQTPGVIRHHLHLLSPEHIKKPPYAPFVLLGLLVSMLFLSIKT